MRRVFAMAAIGFAALLVSLLLARIHPFGDPVLYSTYSDRAVILRDTSVPAEVREILTAKCADCHSSGTRAPFYGRFAPVSWLMERDIVEARKAMNLSVWKSYSAEGQEEFKAKILNEVRRHAMPPFQYRAIHRDAHLTSAEIQILNQWVRVTPVLSSFSAVHGSNAGDPVSGEEVFKRRCTGCHDLDRNREGPQLRNVFGRISGSVESFGYSPALKKAHIPWNEETLDKWLTDPDAFVPGNNMEFRMTKPQERRDLIQFLKGGPPA
jgi:cytochrome c